jgi:hypothetical protein
MVEDRVQFIQSIHLNNTTLKDCIKECFNQMMFLYNVVHHYDLGIIDMSIDNSIVKFSLTYDDISDAQNIEDNLKLHNIIEIYNTKYQLCSLRNETVISIKLTKI